MNALVLRKKHHKCVMRNAASNLERRKVLKILQMHHLQLKYWHFTSQYWLTSGAEHELFDVPPAMAQTDVGMWIMHKPTTNMADSGYL